MTTLNPLSNSFSYNQRSEELLNRIHYFEKEMGISEPVSLKIRKFHKSACAHLNKHVVKVPFWLLFRHEDVPAQFLLRDLQDPRLLDSAFLTQMAAWMNQKIQEAGLTHFCRPTDFGTLQLFLQLLRDPAEYARARDFVIGHEVAHLAHTKEEWVAEMLSMAQDSVAAFGVIAPLFCLVLILGFSPLISAVAALSTAGIALSISTASFVIWFTQKNSPPSLSDIEQEKKADLDSAQALHNAAGGIYYFDTVRIHQLRIRNSNSASSSIDPLGNNLKDKKHPPLTDRVAYLRQWQSDYQRA